MGSLGQGQKVSPVTSLLPPTSSHDSLQITDLAVEESELMSFMHLKHCISYSISFGFLFCFGFLSQFKWQELNKTLTLKIQVFSKLPAKFNSYVGCLYRGL